MLHIIVFFSQIPIPNPFLLFTAKASSKISLKPLNSEKNLMLLLSDPPRDTKEKDRLIRVDEKLSRGSSMTKRGAYVALSYTACSWTRSCGDCFESSFSVLNTAIARKWLDVVLEENVPCVLPKIAKRLGRKLSDRWGIHRSSSRPAPSGRRPDLNPKTRAAVPIRFVANPADHQTRAASRQNLETRAPRFVHAWTRPDRIFAPQPERPAPTPSRVAPASELSRARAQAELTPAFKPSRLQLSSRADPSLQVEPVPAFLVEPIRLSLSRQPALVPLHLFYPIVLVSSEFTTDQYVLGAPPGHRRPDFRSYGSACCTCSGTCQLLGAEVRARASWRATRSDRGEP
ncbi:putative UDP-sugar transporter [Cucumis melo var. makuwa]|uniref:Putative UDP-sugar transporter n=1 Tax=Cucumis melo var. makuwa TaxID=1194695 RepID=A0A5D3BAI3_CUCMM|nr:putative UDP-sugar transporter [Cucumis melo var. makuwa]